MITMHSSRERDTAADTEGIPPMFHGEVLSKECLDELIVDGTLVWQPFDLPLKLPPYQSHFLTIAT